MGGRELLLFQQVKRQRAIIQKRIVKPPDVKMISKFPFCLYSKLSELQLTYLISECLSGPDDVTVHFHDNVVFALGGILLQEINHYQLEVGSMVIWLEAGSQAKATSPTECG